jgi:hypothetical protein
MRHVFSSRGLLRSHELRTEKWVREALDRPTSVLHLVASTGTKVFFTADDKPLCLPWSELEQRLASPSMLPAFLGVADGVARFALAVEDLRPACREFDGAHQVGLRDMMTTMSAADVLLASASCASFLTFYHQAECAR